VSQQLRDLPPTDLGRPLVLKALQGRSSRTVVALRLRRKADAASRNSMLAGGRSNERTRVRLGDDAEGASQDLIRATRDSALADDVSQNPPASRELHRVAEGDTR